MDRKDRQAINTPQTSQINPKQEHKKEQHHYHEDRVYDMSKEKIALLFGHKSFKDPYNYDRSYAEKDCNILKESLESYGFTVSVYLDATEAKLLEVIHKASQRDNVSCMLVYVTTRGINKVLQAADRNYPRDKIIRPIRESKFLVGKPKIFIFQTTDDVFSMRDKTEMDGSPQSKPVSTIPSHADMMTIKLKTAECYAKNHPRDANSIFIFTLCYLLEKNGKTMDLKSIITLANQMYVKTRKPQEDVFAKEDFVRCTDSFRKLFHLKSIKI